MPSRLFFLFIGLCLFIVAGIAWHSSREVRRFQKERAGFSEVVSSLGLADLAFAHDARYTRHISQADLFSAFQDYPGSIEHFPSGSVTPPPEFTSLQTTIGTGKR